MVKEIWSWVKTFALAIIIALVIRNYVVAFYIVDGSSMQPTLADGQVLMVNNLSYRIWEPKYGDVIVFKKEGYTHTSGGNWLVGRDALVKRIIGLPGDTVYIDSGIVYLNGIVLEEEYVDCEIFGSYGPITLEDGMIFVLGDNRNPNGSTDSRIFGPVPISSVIGRAEYVILPKPHKVD